MSNQIDTVKFATAPELIDHLWKLKGEGEAPEFRSKWVYRGHNIADWELKPSAWRNDGNKKLQPLIDWLRPQLSAAFENNRSLDFLSIVAGNTPSQADIERLHARKKKKMQQFSIALQIAAEVEAVRQFCSLADELGLSISSSNNIPNINTIKECVQEAKEISTYNGTFIALNERRFFIDIPFAMAQHHGIPTRYLDWTRDPLIAAYFATVDHEQAYRCENSELCIWGTLINDPKVQDIAWITVPRNQHLFLHAQDAVFSFKKDGDNYYNKNDCWPSFEQGFARNDEYHPPVLKKLLLPRAEAGALRQELAKRRISKAQLMPTFDNVATTVCHQWEWCRSTKQDSLQE